MPWTAVFLLGTVSGKDYTGGFAGLATLGAVTSIDENKGLLDLVKNFLQVC